MAVDDQKVAKRADAALFGTAGLGEGGNARLALGNPREQVEAGRGEHRRRAEVAEDARDDRRRRRVFHEAVSDRGIIDCSRKGECGGML